MSKLLQMNDNIQKAMRDLVEELDTVEKRWAPYHCAHTALGVIREEYIEFEKIVFQKQKERDLNKMRAELIQLATTAIRAAAHCCNEEVGRR